MMFALKPKMIGYKYLTLEEYFVEIL